MSTKNKVIIIVASIIAVLIIALVSFYNRYTYINAKDGVYKIDRLTGDKYQIIDGVEYRVIEFEERVESQESEWWEERDIPNNLLNSISVSGLSCPEKHWYRGYRQRYDPLAINVWNGISNWYVRSVELRIRCNNRVRQVMFWGHSVYPFSQEKYETESDGVELEFKYWVNTYPSEVEIVKARGRLVKQESR